VGLHADLDVSAESLCGDLRLSSRLAGDACSPPTICGDGRLLHKLGWPGLYRALLVFLYLTPWFFAASRVSDALATVHAGAFCRGRISALARLQSAGGRYRRLGADCGEGPLGGGGQCFGRWLGFVATFSRRRIMAVPGDECLHQPRFHATSAGVGSSDGRSAGGSHIIAMPCPWARHLPGQKRAAVGLLGLGRSRMCGAITKM